MDPEELNILWWIIKASSFAVVPPAVLFALRWWRLSSAQRFFGFLVLFVLVIQLVSLAVLYWFKKENMPLYHLYTLIEGAGLILLYRFRLRETPLAPILPWIAGAFAFFVPVNALLMEDLFDLPVVARSVEGLIVIGLVLYYFRTLFEEQRVMYLNRSFWFWLSAGLVLYFLSNVLLFMFHNQLRPFKDVFLAVWAVHGLLNFVLYTFYSIAILCPDRESSFSS